MWILGNFFYDFIFLISPGIIGIIFSQIHSSISHDPSFNLISFLLLTNIIDQGHIYTTILRLPKNEEKNINYILVPIMVFLIFTLFFYFQFKYTIFLVSYYALFHFYKQHEGFVRLYMGRSGFYNKTTIYLFAIFSIVSIVAYHFNPNSMYNYNIRIFLLHNLDLYKIFEFLHYLFILFFLIHEAYKLYIKRFSLNSFIYVMYTMLVFTYAHIMSKTAEDFIYVHLFGHGIPYLAMIFHSTKKLYNFSPKKVLGIMILIIIFFASTDFYLDSIYDEYVFDDLFELIKEPNLFIAALGALTTTPQVCHFIVDRYIWKTKNKDAKIIYK